MASFGTPEKQAERAIKPYLALNQARHGNSDDGKIHSVGSARSYRSALTGMAKWLKTNHLALKLPINTSLNVLKSFLKSP